MRQRGRERVEIDEDLQQFVFRPYQNTEIAEKTGVSTRVALDYRKAESKPPRDVFEDCFEEVKGPLETDFRPSGDIYPKSKFALLSNESHPFSEESESILVKDAGLEEIGEVNRATRTLETLEDEEPELYGGIMNHPEDISTILETSQDPLRGNTVKRKELETSSSPFYRGLKELGVLTPWGGAASNYEITASETYLETLEYIASHE